ISNIHAVVSELDSSAIAPVNDRRKCITVVQIMAISFASKDLTVLGLFSVTWHFSGIEQR
ncbi:hypothetical protein, partial [Alicyclobacillus fastidiosus]